MEPRVILQMASATVLQAGLVSTVTRHVLQENGVWTAGTRVNVSTEARVTTCMVNVCVQQDIKGYTVRFRVRKASTVSIVSTRVTVTLTPVMAVTT